MSTTDRPTTDTMLMPVEKLVQGVMVDLAGDEYADPTDDDPSFEDQYAVVVSVEQEAPECTAVEFEGTWVGFPHGHQVRVRREG